MNRFQLNVTLKSYNYLTINSLFMSLNTMIVASVTNFSGTTTPDKNGETPVMIQCIAGQMPNRNVLSGTVAMRAGFEVGKTYLVNVRETGYDDIFGPDFTFIKVMELNNGLDIVRAAKELGEPRVLFVTRPEGFESVYRRKGDAVESNRAKRIKEGAYHPAYPTTIGHHETAQQIRRGSSQNTGGELNIQNLENLDMEFPEPEQHQDYMPEPGNEDESIHAKMSNEEENEEFDESQRQGEEKQSDGNIGNEKFDDSNNRSSNTDSDKNVSEAKNPYAGRKEEGGSPDLPSGTRDQNNPNRNRGNRGNTGNRR